MLNTPLSPWPSYSEAEIAAVTQVLRSNKVNYWTGDESRAFEQEFAAYLGCSYAIALANGTLALDLALHVLGVGAGDEVIVTPRTFLASASCIVNAGAIPIFADVDPDSQNITAESIAEVLSPRTKAVICVHLAGWPCDMDPIMALARQHGFFVIEDCAQAHGARYKGKHVGTLGHVNAWSFCQDKIMTTGGEGGMLTTNDHALWAKAWSYKDHGKSWDAVYQHQHPPGFRWVHQSFGTNWRITEMQSAIGRVQLRLLDQWKAKRQYNAAVLDDIAKRFKGVRPIEVPAEIDHARYKHYFFIEPKYLNKGWSRDRIIAALMAAGVPCYHGSCSEIYLEQAFDDTGFRPQERLTIAQRLGETSLMFLVHPTLTEQEIQQCATVLESVFQEAFVA